MDDEIFIIANRLPFKYTKIDNKTEITRNAGGLVSAILSLVDHADDKLKHSFKKITWIGNDNFLANNINLIEKNSNIKLHPIAIPKEIENGFYNGFCNSTIWPLFHYYPYLTQYKNSFFEAYKKANLLVFEEIKEIIKEDSTIWIHDYHFMLLPLLIRKKFPKIKIGYFHHIPFPSYEIFRMLPKEWRLEVINGLLGADLIGFHTYEYVKYFLESVRKVTNYDYNQREIIMANRVLRVDSFPIGIDFSKFNETDTNENIMYHRKELKNKTKNIKCILSVDRLDYSKGLIYRLRGFEEFLEKYPQWHEKISLLMIVVPSRDVILTYQQMKRELEESVGRINGKYGTISWTPIIYQYRSLDSDELIAYYKHCDIALITPIRDGMNLVAKEFIAARSDGNGVLILSEMAGAAAELGEAIIINPTDKNEIAESILLALDMDKTEKKKRIQKMQTRIKQYDVFLWADDFLNELDSIKSRQNKFDSNIIDKKHETSIKKHYDSSIKRLLVFDYDGTLVDFSDNPKESIPSLDLINLLNNLSEDQNNLVVITSGRDKKSLDKWFKNTSIYLVSEHGAFERDTSGEWVTQCSTDNRYLDIFLPVLKKYVLKCPNSFIENKDYSLVWHYRNSDIEQAKLRATELSDELNLLINNNIPYQVMSGNKIVEIKPIECNKGNFIKKLLLRTSFDFILTAGDDITDEYIFKAMPDDSYTIKIGLTPSYAKYNIESSRAFIDLIKKLIK